MAIARIVADRYVIQLLEVVSDSTHGDQPAFELITVRLTDSDVSEGVGYTYTGGYGGRAILSLLRDELIPFVVGKNETDIDGVWNAMWWRVHFVGRGGAVSFAMAAIDTALWDLRARKAGLPLWRLLGGTDPHVRIYAGGIDLMYPLDKLLRQTEGNLHVHLLAAVPNASFLEAHGYGLERYMAHSLVLKGGYAVAPERPGHGVELDWAALDRLKG